MRIYKKDGVPYLRFESFPNNGLVQHAVFTRMGGISPAPFDSLNLSVSVPDIKENVFQNRRLAYGTHHRESHSLVHAHLHHGSEVIPVTHRHYGDYVGPADGLITREPGCGLTMNYADCAPIMLYDPANQAISLGHAGWKGAVKDLPGALVASMVEVFNSDPAAIVAAIGPAIGPCCYQVGSVVIESVRESFPEPEELLLPDKEADERRYFDLPEANRRRLLDAGVREIEMAGLCTACRADLFFSHRAENGRTGRFGALLLLGD